MQIEKQGEVYALLLTEKEIEEYVEMLSALKHALNLTECYVDRAFPTTRKNLERMLAHFIVTKDTRGQDNGNS